MAVLLRVVCSEVSSSALFLYLTRGKYIISIACMCIAHSVSQHTVTRTEGKGSKRIGAWATDSVSSGRWPNYLIRPQPPFTWQSAFCSVLVFCQCHPALLAATFEFVIVKKKICGLGCWKNNLLSVLHENPEHNNVLPHFNLYINKHIILYNIK